MKKKKELSIIEQLEELDKIIDHPFEVVVSNDKGKRKIRRLIL